ncbi:allantoate amidohydrolase [Marinomonas epiphytica]
MTSHPMISHKSAMQIMAQAEVLATFSDIDYGVSRAYLTPEHKAAHQQIAVWMKQAGLEVWQDSVGNQWGRKVAKSPSMPSLLLGSHSDTVVNAGKYDGTLGVLLAIQALAELKNEDFPFHIDVVAFADEEGTRFNTTLIGSSAVSGDFDPNWLSVQDSQGITMAQAMQEFGLDPDKAGKDHRLAKDLLAYLEVHIEQGPVLESKDLAVGVVTGIAGAKRYQVSLTGMAGHAGTVPMALRQDALMCAAQMMLAIEQHAQSRSIVATVGKCQVGPGAVNVIPGQVAFTIDIRSQDQDRLEQACDDMLVELENIAGQRNMGFQAETLYQAKAVPCNGALQQDWSKVVEQHTAKAALSLSSGAGHDAMVIANIADIGMLFVRCEKGISHNPKEKVETADVAMALDCFVSMIKRMKLKQKQLDEPMFGLGIGGNSAGHLEQTGEIQAFASPSGEGPQAIFPFYVPQAKDAYLAVNPYSSTHLVLPQLTQEAQPKVQMEPELALKATLRYDQQQRLIVMHPYAMTLVNDASYRNAIVDKLAQKKNWGPASKGLAVKDLELPSFDRANSLAHYQLCGFHCRNKQWLACTESVSIADYSVFYEDLLAWSVSQMMEQTEQGVLHDFTALLAQANYPQEILLSVGAARYTDYGEQHALAPGDELVVVLFNSQVHSLYEITTLIKSGQDLHQLSGDDVLFLHQQVVAAC